MTAIQVQDVRLCYGSSPALDGVTLAVESGELLPVLGPSGCGKTSLLRVLAGLAEPDAGEVRVGNDVFNDPRSRVPAHRRGVGMVFQQLALWPHLSVEKNLEFGLKAQRVRTAERRDRIRQALERVGLGDLGRRLPGALSGGERQRVALARALVGRPRLLLLDEPLSSVDAMLKEELLRQVLDINRDLGLTTLYVTHDKDEALLLGQRVAIMEQGRLVQVDDPETLYRQPANRFVATLMGIFNLFWISGDDTGVPDRARPLTHADPHGPPPPGARLAALPPRGLALADGQVDGALDGTVETSMFQGDHWRLAVRAGALHLHLDSDCRLEPGTRVAVILREKPVILSEGDRL